MRAGTKAPTRSALCVHDDVVIVCPVRRERYSLTMEQIWTAVRLSWGTLQAREGNRAAATVMEQASV